VARGNDGNLLQHAIEVAVAQALGRQAGVTSLRLVCTHAMAPFEALTGPASLDSSARLRGRLRQATAGQATEDLPVLVRAYHDLGASPARYPNTAALVEWVARQQGIVHGNAS
jgi:hypothetical protein